MKCLGLDLGSKTLGIAISDMTNTIATIYTTLRFDEDDYGSLISQLKDIILKNDIDVIVLGLPKNMNNTLGKRAEITLDFKDMLEKKLDVKVALMDERLTSVISNNVMIEADMSRKKRKKKVDGIAAQIILQDYLDRERTMKNGREE